MTEEVPLLKPIGDVERCATQNRADEFIQAQMQRWVDKLEAKSIYPVLVSGLFVVNCGAHAEPRYHIDLVVSPMDRIKPEILPHTISALEQLLSMLKAGST